MELIHERLNVLMEDKVDFILFYFILFYFILFFLFTINFFLFKKKTISVSDLHNQYMIQFQSRIPFRKYGYKKVKSI